METTNYFAQAAHSDAFWRRVATLADKALEDSPARAAQDAFWYSEGGKALHAYAFENAGYQGYPDAEALMMKEALWENWNRDYEAAVLAAVEQAKSEGLS